MAMPTRMYRISGVKSRTRRCAYCKQKVSTEDAKINGLRAFCSIDHALAWLDTEKGQNTLQKARNKKNKSAREKLKTKSDYAKEAQTAFNAYIRLRDDDKPCISCGRYHQGQYHAGHYRTTAAAPQIRFNTYNVHKQCSVCNNHKSGNIVEYRINLIGRIGQDRLEELENNQASRPYSIEYLQRLKRIFQKKVRIIKKIREKC
jgi:hypothetical protein